MAIQGLRDTTNFVTDQRPKNWREGILLLYPNGKLTLTGLTSLMSSRGVDDPEYNWWTKTLDARRFALSAAISSTSATTFSVTSGALSLKDGDLLLIEQSSEIVLVNGDPSTDTSITVIRGYSGTTPATVAATTTGINPNMTKIGSAYEEGSTAPTGVNYDPTKVYNYTQIFRETLEITRTAQKTRLRTGDAVKEAKRECLEYFGNGMELAFWFGQRAETTRNGKPLRTTGGVMSFIDSGNIKTVTTDYSGGLTMTGLEEYMYNIFKYGSSEKMAIGGNRALLTLQQVIRKNSNFQIFSGIKEYGMNVTRLVCPFGEIVFKSHPLFNQMTSGTTGTGPYYGVESWMFVLDMTNIKYVYLNGSDVKYEPELQANGMDGMKSGYIAECGLEFHHPLSHYLLKNLVAATTG